VAAAVNYLTVLDIRVLAARVAAVRVVHHPTEQA